MTPEPPEKCPHCGAPPSSHGDYFTCDTPRRNISLLGQECYERQLAALRKELEKAKASETALQELVATLEVALPILRHAQCDYLVADINMCLAKFNDL